MKELTPFIFSLFTVIISSFIFTDRIIPVIIKKVTQKKLYVEPNIRSSHIKKTPSLGGISFYLSILTGLLFLNIFDFYTINYQFLGAITLMFLLGLRDDIKPLSAIFKILFQSLSILLFLSASDLYISSFHGFLGIYQLPIWFSYMSSYFILLFIINAYNLIDGIDGLAGMIGIYISLVFALFYFFIGLYFYSLIAILIISFLIAFLKYNLSDNNKIFMGDTGSLVVGLLLGILTLRFLSLDILQLHAINVRPENSIIILLSILFIPVFDVLRVIVIRLLNKRKPFGADRSHLHHLFIDKGLKHKKASITITLINIIIFIFVYSINIFFSHSLFLFSFFLLFIIFSLLMLILGTDQFSRSFRKKIKSKIPECIYKIEFQFRKITILFIKNLFYKELL